MPRKGDCKPVLCGHPEQPHHALNQCRKCWQRGYVERNGKKRFVRAESVVTATCGHPERRGMVKGQFIGLCSACVTRTYRTARRYTRRRQGTCQEHGCTEPGYAGKRSGFIRCVNHYANWRWRHGGLLRRKLATSRRAESV